MCFFCKTFKSVEKIDEIAKKHNLSTCRLRQVLNSSKKNYKVEEKTLWVFRKEDEEYKRIKKYK